MSVTKWISTTPMGYPIDFNLDAGEVVRGIAPPAEILTVAQPGRLRVGWGEEDPADQARLRPLSLRFDPVAMSRLQGGKPLPPLTG
jgi:hypothetical protein